MNDIPWPRYILNFQVCTGGAHGSMMQQLIWWALIMDTASPKVSNGAIPIPKPLRLHPEANKRKRQCSTFKENKAILRAHLETTMNSTPCKIQCIFLQTFAVQIPHPWKMKFSLGAVMASRGESTHFRGKKEEKRRAGFPNSKPSWPVRLQNPQSRGYLSIFFHGKSPHQISD